METFLHKLRTENGYSQSQLANISGVNLRTLQDFEQGRKSLINAKGEMIYRLCQALDCSCDFLLSNSITEANIGIHPITDNKNHIEKYYQAFSSKPLYAKYYRFPVLVTGTPIDMSRIYPTKQHLVSQIYGALSPNPDITSIMLFGSSITMQCNADSDIDLAVRLSDSSISREIKNSVSEEIQEICGWNADIIWYDTLLSSERIYHDICRGVQIV